MSSLNPYSEEYKIFEKELEKRIIDLDVRKLFYDLSKELNYRIVGEYPSSFEFSKYRLFGENETGEKDDFSDGPVYSEIVSPGPNNIMRLYIKPQESHSIIGMQSYCVPTSQLRPDQRIMANNIGRHLENSFDIDLGFSGNR